MRRQSSTRRSADLTSPVAQYAGTRSVAAPHILWTGRPAILPAMSQSAISTQYTGEPRLSAARHPSPGILSGDNSRVLNLLGNVFSWTVTALFGAITLLLAFESWALLTNREPITDYIRPAVHTYPGFAFVIAVVIGILVGHFLWGPAYGRTSPVGKK